MVQFRKKRLFNFATLTKETEVKALLVEVSRY
jgi:hypothetical protein